MSRLTFLVAVIAYLSLAGPTHAQVAPADCLHDRQDIFNLLGVHVQKANVAISQLFWELEDIAFCDPFIGGGKVNIFYRVKDQNGQFITNQACTANFGATNITVFTKVFPDWGDYAMSGGNWCPDWQGGGGHGPYSAWVNGHPSDRVIGMGLPCNQHISFYLTWRLKVKSAPTTGGIVGSVKDGANNGIRNATVTVNPGGHIGQTDFDGNYEIFDLAPGTYSVTAEKLGFVAQTQNGKTVVVGQETVVDFTLASSRGIISGFIRDDSSFPIEGAYVTVPTGHGAVTNASGQYDIVGVPAGTYTVTAWAPAKNENTSAGHGVTPGTVTNVDIVLSPKPGRVAHLLFDYNDSYYNEGFNRFSSSFNTGVTNQRFSQATAAGKVRPPHTGTNSSQQFAYEILDDNFASWISTSDPVSGHQDVDLVGLAQSRGWEGINPVFPITYIFYVKGHNGATDPDDPGMYWKQQFSIRYPDGNDGTVEHEWNSSTNDSWHVVRTTVSGLFGGQNQRVTFGYLYPKFFGNNQQDQSWCVVDNFMIEYTPVGAGDITPPAPVSSLNASPNALGIQLNWVNPSTADFTGTLIRYRTDRLPTGPNDGVLLVDAPGSPLSGGAYSHTTGLLAGQTYYYGAFAHDAKPNYATVVTAQAIAPSGQPGDFDGDGDVDQSDYGQFQLCVTGSGQIQNDPNCLAARLDADVDVDQDDFGIFQACMSGPNKPANPNCAD